MKKIPSLFARDGRHITREFHPDASWVVNGEGVATRKFDGTPVRIKEGRLFVRYDAKNGKTPPPDFVPCQEAPDPITTHFPGWVPATRPEDIWVREAYESALRLEVGLPDWTYEACGPRIGANQEGYNSHILIKHGSHVLIDAPRTYDDLLEFFGNINMEGIVWWRDINDVDCDKVKITGSALGVGHRKSKR